MSVILIGVPTCKRPVMLAACLESIGRMDFPADAEVRLAVADNDAAESARKVVEEFARRAPLPVDYSVCPERGLSNIRNHLLDRALAAGAAAWTTTARWAKPGWRMRLPQSKKPAPMR